MILGVDWGSSRRRAYLLDDTGDLKAFRSDDLGVFRLTVPFAQAMNELRREMDCADVPAVLTGMVGSRSGWLEAPYLPVPFPLIALRGAGVAVPGTETGHPTKFGAVTPAATIIPGACDLAGPDVMRGEETQLLGAVRLLDAAADGLYVLPGTHSKWARIDGGRLLGFRTYLTGELYDTLSVRGTLAAVIGNAESAPEAEFGREAAIGNGFDAGLAAAKEGKQLSAALFGLRAGVLLGKLPAAEARSFLSGLLIGAEWAEQLNGHRRGNGSRRERRTRWKRGSDRIRILGSERLAPLYERAATFFGAEAEVIDAEAAYITALRFLGGLE